MAGAIGNIILVLFLSTQFILLWGKQLDICDRVPIHTTAPRTPGDHGFKLQVKGLSSPGKYSPGQTYQGKLFSHFVTLW